MDMHLEMHKKKWWVWYLARASASAIRASVSAATRIQDNAIKEVKAESQTQISVRGAEQSRSM